MSFKVEHPAPLRRRVLIASSVGNAIEWYDFAVYGFVAAYLGALFFPSDSPTTELLASFAVFGLTFFVRPVGGLVLGSFSDRFGRKKVLVFSVVLMAVATTAIGLLPTYATIGVTAPILLVLLRCLQGFSAGGEYGSVTSFLLEHSPQKRRGFAMSWLMWTCVVGFLAGAIVATGLGAIIGDEAMKSWGWRIPFLIAGLLGVIGLYIRSRLEESPEFVAIVESQQVAKTPLREVFAYRRQLFSAVGIGAFHSAAFYTIMTFLISFVAVTVGRGSTAAFWAALFAGLASLIVIPVAGAASDRFGRRPILITAAIGFATLSIPLLALIRDGSSLVAVFAQLGFGVLLGILVSTSVVAMTEIFPTRVRASAAAVGYNISAAVFGGTAPFIAALLVAWTGSSLSPAYYLAAVALLGLLAAVFLPPAALTGLEDARTAVRVDAVPAEVRTGDRTL